ncbi:MAG: hypothetical protein E7331_03520 [Clostridiales bacterium]|nr:hypothetical protein [Clostridiales bacterium]
MAQIVEKLIFPDRSRTSCAYGLGITAEKRLVGSAHARQGDDPTVPRTFDALSHRRENLQWQKP